MTTPRLLAAMFWVFASAAMAAEPADADRAARTEQAANADRTDASQQNTEPAERSAPSAAPGPSSTTRAGTRADRLDLDTTVVTGNRELPKVLYIVPWKKADIGDLPGQPFNTLLDEALTPVDRDVFRREVTYYGAISGDSNGAAPPASARPQASGGSEK